MLREKRNIAARSGPSSITISTKSPPFGAGPTTRMMSLSEQKNSVSNASHDGAQHRGVAQVDVVVDRVRHVVDGEQPALVAHLHRDRLGAEVVEDLLHHGFGELRLLLVGLGVEHERDGARDRDAVGQPGEAEIGDRGHVDQHFGDHHEQDREHAAACRTARSAAHARAPSLPVVRLRESIQSSRSLRRHLYTHPNRRKKPIRRRTLGLVKLGEK